MVAKVSLFAQRSPRIFIPCRLMTSTGSSLMQALNEAFDCTRASARTSWPAFLIDRHLRTTRDLVEARRAPGGRHAGVGKRMTGIARSAPVGMRPVMTMRLNSRSGDGQAIRRPWHYMFGGEPGCRW